MGTRSTKRVARHVRVWGAINIAGAVVASTLLVYSLSQYTPESLASQTLHMLGNASVGMSVGIEPNEHNTIAQQLEQKADELRAREAAVLDREITSARTSSADRWGVYSFFASMVLFGLVLLNFFFDTRRRNVRPTPSVAPSLSINLKR